MRIVILGGEGTRETELAGLHAPLAAASTLLREQDPAAPAWNVEIVAHDPVFRGEQGLRLAPHALDEPDATPADVALVPGGPAWQDLQRRPRVLDALTRARTIAGASGEGLLVLARAGLLEGRRVAAPRDPHVRDALSGAGAHLVEGARVVADARLVTSVGGSPGATALALTVVGKLATEGLALDVAQRIHFPAWGPAAASSGHDSVA